MSVSRWAYIPERCDGEACPGDCDLCSKAQDNIALMEGDNDVMDDTIFRADAIALASGGCHPANLAEELAKLPSAQKTGRWIYLLEEYTYQCSECLMVEPNGGFYCYCPNCGADMRGEEDG